VRDTNLLSYGDDAMSLPDADKLELQQLLMKYTHILDYGNIDAMDEIWTEDCEFRVDNPVFVIEGLANLKQTLGGTSRDHPHVRHVVSNCYVDDSGADVYLKSYLQIVDVSQFKVTMFARYIDKCVKTTNGWRIAERSCING
jgi:3-phenylpropionate/cinnamic acid dioxygenase small subunit